MHMDRFFVGAASSRDGIAQDVNSYRGWKPLQRHHVSLCIYGHLVEDLLNITHGT